MEDDNIVNAAPSVSSFTAEEHSLRSKPTMPHHLQRHTNGFAFLRIRVVVRMQIEYENVDSDNVDEEDSVVKTQ